MRGTTSTRLSDDTVVQRTPAALDEGLLALVDRLLTEFVTARTDDLTAVSPRLHDLAAVAATAVTGGKRIRARFCHLGWLGAGGAAVPAVSTSAMPGHSEAVVGAAAALELFHLAALIHDDVMDRSDTRRGRRTAHRHFADLHRAEGLQGDGSAHGDAVAVLLGDLCLTWSDELMDHALQARRDAGRGRDAAAARAVFAAMRTQVIAGQYLDIAEQASRVTDATAAVTVAKIKSAKYTVEHPLVLGGALAGGSAALLEQYAAFGLPVGLAFQLRDDLLGAFGDTVRTGKPSGDDLRAGKKTLLVARAYERATDLQRRVLDRHLGDADLTAAGLADVREILMATGAVLDVEQHIARLVEEANGQLETMPVAPGTRTALALLASSSIWRSA